MARSWTDLAERVEKIGRTAADVPRPESPLAAAAQSPSPE
jgi:hypothetical protein